MAQPKTAIIPHIGRKIERIRTIKGIKQDDLAKALGMSQSALSKIEQSEVVDEKKLKQIADALQLSVETLKSFDENALVNLINNIHNNSFDNHSIAFIYHQFNSVDKMLEIIEENKKLYERLLESEREKSRLLEEMLKKKP